MADGRRRYLAQQAEIGGAEVILSRPREDLLAEARTERATAGLKARSAEVAAGIEAEGANVESNRKTAAGTKGTDWRVGAPPIPGPGLVIESPAGSLVDGAEPAWASLEQVAEAVAACTSCFLAKGRTNVVPGEGNPRPELVLVGEGPGQTEDETGRPFVGRAGELLNGILAAIGYARTDVFICNVVKCRPPGNRKPLPDEMAACSPFLDAQLRLLRPRVILALGATAAEALLGARRPLSEVRGLVHSYRGIPLVVTYHPAALLRNPAWKKPTWDDVRIARQLADR